MSWPHKFLILLFICLNLQGSAQTRTVDSLKKRVLLATNNAEKTKALLDLCRQKYSLTANTIYHYASDLKKLSKANQDSHAAILADYYTAYSLLVNSMEDSSLKIANYYLAKLQNNSAEQEAYILFFQLKGLIYYRTNKAKETVNTCYNLLSEAQQRKDTLSMIIAKRGIAMSYTSNGQDQEALKLIHNAIELIPDKSSSKYKELYGLLLVSTGICFLHIHQATHSKMAADSCDYYGTAGISIGQKTENLFLLCQGLLVKGLILSYQKKNAEAEQYLQQGLQVRKIIGDTLYIISDMSVLASFYANTKQLKSGMLQ